MPRQHGIHCRRPAPDPHHRARRAVAGPQVRAQQSGRHRPRVARCGGRRRHRTTQLWYAMPWGCPHQHGSPREARSNNPVRTRSLPQPAVDGGPAPMGANLSWRPAVQRRGGRRPATHDWLWKTPKAACGHESPPGSRGWRACARHDGIRGTVPILTRLGPAPATTVEFTSRSLRRTPRPGAHAPTSGCRSQASPSAAPIHRATPAASAHRPPGLRR